jgi:hypothetical protein
MAEKSALPSSGQDSDDDALLSALLGPLSINAGTHSTSGGGGGGGGGDGLSWLETVKSAAARVENNFELDGVTLALAGEGGDINEAGINALLRSAIRHAIHIASPRLETSLANAKYTLVPEWQIPGTAFDTKPNKRVDIAIFDTSNATAPICVVEVKYCRLGFLEYPNGMTFNKQVAFKMRESDPREFLEQTLAFLRKADAIVKKTPLGDFQTNPKWLVRRDRDTKVTMADFIKQAQEQARNYAKTISKKLKVDTTPISIVAICVGRRVFVLEAN